MSIPFSDHGSTQRSGNDGGARIRAGSDPAATGLGELASREPGRLYIAAFGGSHRTGGYDIGVVGVERTGGKLTVRALFSSPKPGALTIQVLTSPAQLISIDEKAGAGARELLLVDQSGVIQARSAVPQSQP